MGLLSPVAQVKAERVFLADQHPIARRGLQAILERSPAISIVGEAGTVAEVEPLVSQAAPTIVLLDFMQPPRPGIALIRSLKRMAAPPAVLVVTGEAVEEIALPALEAGADGVINKNGNCTDYVEAVQRVASGKLYLCPCAQSHVVHALLDAGRARDVGLLASLSEAEREVLYGTVCGFTNHEIALEMKLPVTAVARLKGHLREKLNTHRREDLVAFAMRVDLLHRESAHPWIGEHI